MFFAFHCLGLCVLLLKKKMFPKYLTPGKNISNKLVLIEIEEKFQIED